MKMKSKKGFYTRKFVDIFFLFLMGALIGWSYEVILHLIRDGAFVNRGMLHGPWLPIYGIGCVLMVGLKRWTRGNPVFYFFACFFASAVLEYATSWLLESIYYTRWWDYSDLSLNLNGRIFLGGLLGFSLAGCALVYVLLPVIKKLYCKIPYHIVKLAAYILIIIFILDAVISIFFPNVGAGVTW